MPKTKPFRREEQQRNVRALIAKYMELRKANEEKVAAQAGMVKRSLQNKRRHPETFRLGELWDVCDALDVPDEERIEILRKR